MYLWKQNQTGFDFILHMYVRKGRYLKNELKRGDINKVINRYKENINVLM